jgi:hypothetical protein
LQKKIEQQRGSKNPKIVLMSFKEHDVKWDSLELKQALKKALDGCVNQENLKYNKPARV